MYKPDNDKIKLLIHKIGLKHNLQDKVINSIVHSPYKFTRKVITDLSIDDSITEEQFNQLKTNFIYLYIGKLYTNFLIFNKFKKLEKAKNDNLNNKKNEFNKRECTGND